MKTRDVVLSLSLSLPLSAAALVMSACKTAAPPQGSEAKSLDNFTGTAKVTNVCAGSQGSAASQDAISTPGGAYDAAVLQSLSAVPAALQREFFDKLGGRIEVGAIPAGCRQAGVESQQELDSAMVACFLQSDDGSSIVIHVAEAGGDTERNIRHALVRIFGYVVSEIMLSFPSGNEAPAKVAHLTQLEAELLRLARADLQAAGKADLAARLPDEAAENIFPEAFDSYYCSADTRSNLRRDFPQTLAKFEEQLASQLDEALSDEPVMAEGATEDGMNLWGRWGAGNGPLRQGLRNWANFRANGGGLFNVRRWANGGGFVFQRPWFAPWRWNVWHQ